jgi:hypothetical protein
VNSLLHFDLSRHCSGYRNWLSDSDRTNWWHRELEMRRFRHPTLHPLVGPTLYTPDNDKTSPVTTSPEKTKINCRHHNPHVLIPLNKLKSTPTQRLSCLVVRVQIRRRITFNLTLYLLSHLLLFLIIYKFY